MSVMQELQQSTTKIEQLNLYLDSLGKVLHNSQAIVNTTDAVLKRTKILSPLLREWIQALMTIKKLCNLFGQI